MLSKNNLFSAIIIFICTSSIFAIVYGSDFLKSHVTKLHEKKVLESLEAVLITTNDGLNNWATELKSVSRFIVTNELVQTQIQNILNNNKKVENQEFLSKTLRQLTHSHNFIEASIVSQDMNVIANSTKEKINTTSILNKNAQLLVKLNRGQPVITPPEKSKEFFFDRSGEKVKNLPKFCILTPIYLENEIAAYLIFKLNPHDKFVQVFQSGRIGKTGETYALRNDFTMVSETRFISHLRAKGASFDSSILKQKIIDPETNNPTVMAGSVSKKKAGSNVTGYNDYRGVSVVGAWLWNDNFSIGLTTEQDHLEAFSELNISLDHITNFTIAVILCLVALVLAFIYSARITRKNQLILLKFNDKLKKQVSEGVKEAEAANVAKSKFFSQMSHEIRTPMNAIIGYSELLEQSHLTEDQTENLRQISESGKFLLQLINEILDFSKIESGELVLEETPFDLLQISESIVDLLRYKTSILNVILKLEVDPGLNRYFIGDSHRIKQVIMNLTSNALKFTKNGEVIVKLEKVKSDVNVEWVKISVTDTGIGIDETKIDDIFEDFTQADSSTSRRYGGTGLGLTISKRIIEVMKGEIGVTSTIGQGSTFWFEIPLLATNQVKTNSTALDYDKSSIKDLKVLIAEDNSVNRNLAIKLLTLVGFENLSTASDGNEAVDYVKNNEVDIIFMDVMMPDLDGIEATKIIRAMGYGPEKLKIIALTANAFSEDRNKCIKAGMNEHIKKPFKKNDVVACLKQLNIC